MPLIYILLELHLDLLQRSLSLKLNLYTSTQVKCHSMYFQAYLLFLIVSNAVHKPITDVRLIELLSLVNEIEELIDDELSQGLKLTERDFNHE